jgi:hypothetical protein
VNPDFSNIDADFRDAALTEIPRRCQDSPVALQQRSGRKALTRRTRYFGWEYVFEHICQHCDCDGIWSGDGATVAAEFSVTEDEAHEVLVELCDRGLIESVFSGTYAITEWRDRDESADDLPI